MLLFAMILQVSCVTGSPSALAELKNAIRRTIGGIVTKMLHLAFIRVTTYLTFLMPGIGGHVEHVLF